MAFLFDPVLVGGFYRDRQCSRGLIGALSEWLLSFSRFRGKVDGKNIDLVERIDRVFDKEREADKVKEEITTELSEGAYLPPSRGHLLRK
ncbi:hypothetical protein AKJ39_04500 [candidate division MSBL1 archaeon SCGC-AAA259J03]|uniref:Uncharacterized protein n=1 Tax=candidate division MSBL1 archaeon SCGC-AAA259J03 TaxID=1698269 RepID=A0A656YUU4_9EURY|nr:hypothetical protein AKJ39_04500 [candidate division MSBL1 archaeon SCGC-AAA259J03]